MLQIGVQTATPRPEADPVKRLTMMVTVTNDSINGFQASVQVAPTIFREQFSSMEELARFFVRIQQWEVMKLSVQTD